ncbi:Choline dehydrogenase [Mycena indigotica]|uniref:Choline dehydrogenase n=1 Tax=Mycena indigotica TaxID=2126181 RepID=A0A8H6SQ20_9AGAR|nr:Choline dehydrogenase [Mycena indigotica]KAF7302292.1 Choline dehydrogenase [Mycena indigotica]
MRPLLFIAATTVALTTATPTPIHKRSTTDPGQISGKTFDFVIVGGGTAGLALAARLAEWKNTTIAVIEAGTDGTEFADQITIPGMSYIHGVSGTTHDWAYTTTAQASAANATRVWPRGKGLGGSSATNGGFWCRGSAPEYDAWNALQNGAANAEDWGWEKMQASMKKAETFTPMAEANAALLSVTHDSNAHGTTGPIQSSYSSYQYSHLATWVPTMVNMGLPHTLDPASGDNIGVSFVPSTINPHNGSRSDANFGYIAPYFGTNLVILTGFQVTKINWNSTTSGAAVAGGVSFAANAGGTVYQVNAAKEVILSGGTIGSPQILQVSGVGPKSLLSAHGIQTVVDLPGVGQNLQEHLSASLYMQATDNDTWAALKFDQGLWDEQLAIWRKDGTGMWTYWNEATAYPATTHMMGTDASVWASSINTDSALSISAAASSMDSTVQAGVKAQYSILSGWAAHSKIGQIEMIFNMFGSAASMIGIQLCLQHPFSRGYVNIKSASIFDYPEINPNYLSVSYDLDLMRTAFKYTRKTIATAPMSEMIKTETTPGMPATDDAINGYIASSSGTEYHPIGTNSMLPLERGGVVDTRLIVYGTKNLRVVDVSIAPLHVSAHTMATTYGIAERAADIIKAKYFAVGSSSSSPNSPSSSGGAGSGSGSSNTNNTTNSSSSLSTGTKIAIGAGSAVGAIALIALLVLLRRRGNKRQQNAAFAASTKEEWYPTQPHAPFMAGTGKRNSAFSVDSMATATHPDNEQHVKYDQHYYPPSPMHSDNRSLGSGSEATFHDHPHSQYGAIHADLSTPEVAALHPSHPPSSPGPGSPNFSPSQRYTDLPPQHQYHDQPRH